jgi:hypothetical protein
MVWPVLEDVRLTLWKGGSTKKTDAYGGLKKGKRNINEAKFKHFVQRNNLWVAFTAILKSISQLIVKKYQPELL